MIIPGNQVFKLIDTYGLPFDLINLDCKENGNAIDIIGFMDAAMLAGWSSERIYNTLATGQNIHPEAKLLIETYLKLA